MEIKRINSVRAASAIGPYCHASIVGGTIYLSGQLGLTRAGELVSGGVEAETRQAIDNIQKILEDCNSSLENVIKVTIFLNNMGDFQAVNKIYEEFFAMTRPSRSCVEVSCLPKNAQIEIEAIAHES
jgi:2-iminobutanoate/2-iminopropanoate deaminase